MLSHEISEEDSATIGSALCDVFRDADSPGWSPWKLPEPLLTVWAVEQAQGVIDNGGFGYFYEDDWNEFPPYSLFSDAFLRIGAEEAARCIEATAMLFPWERPELDYQKRRAYLNESREQSPGEPDEFDRRASRFVDLGGETFQLLARYIRDHIEHFPAVDDSKGV